MARKVVYVPGSSRKICQMTGEYDRELGPDMPAHNRTESRFGLRGTDLGASFEHKGRCWFLFGDTHPSVPHSDLRPIDGDSIAYLTGGNPDHGLDLTFVTAADGNYLSPLPPGVSIRGFEVPTGGFSANGAMYIFFTTDTRFTPQGVFMNRSVLLRSDDDGRSFRLVYTVSTDKIIYISPAVVENNQVAGLPQQTGRGLLLWSAAKEYRRSNPYLAWLPLDRVEDKSALRYWAGGDKATGKPQWSEKETDAAPLFAHPTIGELCVTYNRYLRQWLMLYNAEGVPGPRGINFRVSDTPWGPWSDTVVLFNPDADHGYGYYMHVSWAVNPSDTVHDPGLENVYGGEYAPYVISRFTKGDDTRTTIYWLMSTWNPYNVVLMKSTLEIRQTPDVPAAP